MIKEISRGNGSAVGLKSRKRTLKEGDEKELCLRMLVKSGHRFVIYPGKS